MANFICVICSVYDPARRMEGHPVFEVLQDYQTHMWQSHGAPAPPVITRNMVNRISGAFPLVRKVDSQTTKIED